MSHVDGGDALTTHPHTAARMALPYRPDLQGLRAVAVVLVLAYHFGVPGFGGGYIGVDVFFVLSGYLISRLLVAEFLGSGSISLRRFAMRRVRRLLPTATLVLVVSMVALWSVAGPVRRGQERLVSVAASIFGANLGLAAEQADYLTAGREPVLQHYWSLGVEEQFYLLWPALVLVALRAGRRWRGGPLRSLLVAVVVLGVLSALWSASTTVANQPYAFFLLPSRAWQLLAGAALAGLELSGRGPSRWRSPLRLVGVVLVVLVTTGLITGPFPWPLAVLPTLGTALLVWAGVDEPRHPVWLTNAPATWVGDRSYALYLWHWPPLVLAGLAGTSLGTSPLLRVVLLVGCVVASALTYRFVEEPLRHGSALTSGRRVMAFGSGAVALSLVVAFAATARPAPEVSPRVAVGSGSPATAAPPAPEASASERDAAVVDSMPTLLPVTEDVVPAVLPEPVRAALPLVADEVPDIYDNGCHRSKPDRAPLPEGECLFGVRGGDLRVALVGDSHAAHWFEAARVVADAAGWELLVATKSGCPLYEIDVTLGGERPYPECDAWQEALLARLAAEDVDVVVVGGVATSLHRQAPAEWAAGVESGLEALRASTDAAVVAVLDPPHVLDEGRVPVCLDERSVADCALRRDESFDQVQREAVRPWVDAVVDTPSLVCLGDVCPAVVGDVVVYRDDDHFSNAFGRELAPHLGEAVLRARAVRDEGSGTR